MFIRKTELKSELENGKSLYDVIGDLRTDGQECWIYCAYIDDKTFMSINRDTVIYIPDIDLNEICDEKRALSNEEIEHILHYCYTIEDFINEAYGNVKAAYSLYMFVDWQNPNINDLRECTDDDEAKEYYGQTWEEMEHDNQ